MADFVAIQSLHRLIHDQRKRIVSLHRSKIADFKAIQLLHRISRVLVHLTFTSTTYLMTSTHSHGFYNNLTVSFGILLRTSVTLMVYICKFMASTGTFMASSKLSRPIAWNFKCLTSIQTASTTISRPLKALSRPLQAILRTL
jgi:hypothetical protein